MGLERHSVTLSIVAAPRSTVFSLDSNSENVASRPRASPACRAPCLGLETTRTTPSRFCFCISELSFEASMDVRFYMGILAAWK